MSGSGRRFRSSNGIPAEEGGDEVGEDAGDTVMTLRHTGLPAAFADEHHGGWAHFLALLAAAIDRSAKEA